MFVKKKRPTILRQKVQILAQEQKPSEQAVPESSRTGTWDDETAGTH